MFRHSINIKRSYFKFRIETYRITITTRIPDYQHIKENVYVNNTASIQDLKDGIREAIDDMRHPFYNMVMKEICSCRSGRGDHLANDIFLLLTAYLPPCL